jgi:hypothetical protein
VLAFYAGALDFLFGCDAVPTAKAVASWAERQQGLDPDWQVSIVNRLRAWPDGHPYPLIPDDDELLSAHMDPDGARARWLTPGTRRGDLVALGR